MNISNNENMIVRRISNIANKSIHFFLSFDNDKEETIIDFQKVMNTFLIFENMKFTFSIAYKITDVCLIEFEIFFDCFFDDCIFFIVNVFL